MATTNTMIIEMYKAEKGIDCPLHTYTKWKSMGYQVKKGEKCMHRITIWKGCTKTAKDKDGNEIVSSRVIMKESCFFTLAQVEPIRTA